MTRTGSVATASTSAALAFLAGVLLASCDRHPTATLLEPQAGAEGAINLAALSHRSLLETGRAYSAQVQRETADGHTTWCVENPPIPHHYAVGFEWSNLPILSDPREGLWTFVVRDIERRQDPSRDGAMGRFTACYKCDVLRIEDGRR